MDKLLRSKRLLGIAALLLALAPLPAAAITCVISTNGMNIGSYTITAQSTLNMTVTVQCTKTINGEKNFAYVVRLNAGTGTFTNRTMSNGTDTLLFNVYQNAGQTIVWDDDTVDAVNTVTGTFAFTAGAGGVGQVLTNTHTAYALIAANQDLSTGNYQDTTLTVTVIDTGSAATLGTAAYTAQAAINPSCAVTANSTLAFGAYDPTSGTAKDASTTIGFRCTKGSIFDIGIGGTVGSRTMTNGTDTLAYELYRDSGRTLTWGNSQDSNTTNVDDVADSTGNGVQATAQSVTVYGRIAAGQDKSPGAYSDTQTITIYY